MFVPKVSQWIRGYDPIQERMLRDMTLIRQATMQDANAICRIDAMVLGNTGRAQELREAVAAGHCYVASLDDGAVVGFVIMNQSFFKQSYIPYLIVHPHHQSKGIGQDLMLHMEAVCTTEKLFTSTNLSNKRMQRLCQRLHYIQSGMIDNLDPGDPEVFYCKQIRKRAKTIASPVQAI